MYFIKMLIGNSFMFGVLFLINIFSVMPKKQERKTDKIIVLTGTFYSKNWINAHLLPLVTSSNVGHVFIVSKDIQSDLQGLTVVRPSSIISKIFGHTIARLFTFFICSFKNKPDYIGGFHILFNATFSVLFAKMLRTRSIYFCVGGITETLETGASENSFFKFIKKKNNFLTETICRIAASADRVITMGHGAKSFLISKGVSAEKIHIISGAIDKKLFFPAQDNKEKKYDLILTARLSPIKQVDLFIDVVKKINQQGTPCQALIVGGGPLLEDLKKYATKVNALSYITFVGHQDCILSWLHQSKVNVLTSRTEGLSLSLLEGLKVGLPGVVPDVGDLSDVLIDGYNGFLIEGHNVDDFAKKIIELLTSPQMLGDFSQHAIETTKRFDLNEVQQQWFNAFE